MTRRRAALAAALGLLAAGCPNERSPGPRFDVLRYTVTHHESSVLFVVYDDGHASHTTSDGPNARDGRTVRAKVTPEELHALARVLRENDFCDLRSKRRRGDEDEARPVVAVRLEDVDCIVRLWYGEVGEEPRARRAFEAIEALERAVAARGR